MSPATMKGHSAFADTIKAVAAEEVNSKLQSVLDHLGTALSAEESKREELVIARFPHSLVSSLSSVEGATVGPSAVRCFIFLYCPTRCIAVHLAQWDEGVDSLMRSHADCGY